MTSEELADEAPTAWRGGKWRMKGVGLADADRKAEGADAEEAAEGGEEKRGRRENSKEEKEGGPWRSAK